MLFQASVAGVLMKLRTQLVIVFVLLAILPLTGIVLYSWASSQKAFRDAVEKETRELAGEMDGRLAQIREDLSRRIERVGVLPIDTLVAAANREAPSDVAAAALARELGESAQFLDRLEWTPDPPPFQEFAALAGDVDTVATTPVVPLPAPAPKVPVPPKPAPLETFVIEIPRFEYNAEGLPVVVGSERKVFTAPEAPRARTREEIAKAVEDARRAAEEAKSYAAKVRVESRLGSPREATRSEVSTVVVHDGSRFGTLTAQVRQEAVLRSVLSGVAPASRDIAFAIDPEGNVLARSDEDSEALSGLDMNRIREGLPHDDGNWVVATSKDAETGFVFGVARPVRDSLRQMRSSAMNSFAWGLGLVALALFGIVPVANHLTRDIGRVMEGVDRIGHGDLDTPVEVRSGNEVGRLASAFNRMALDLKDHQQKLIDQERRRQQSEIEQRVLEAEYDRKTSELEEARRFQLSLLPDSPPSHPDLDIAVHVRTATEVGGDYYDYHLSDDGSLTLAIGDATGHGAKAGTMVTVVKSLFAGRLDGSDLARFLDDANRTIRQMRLERMAMALTVARYDAGVLRIASAGMPPALLFRSRTDAFEELQFEAPPLGSLAHAYQSRSVPLEPGDLLLLMTDGFPELENPAGEPLGYVAAANLFRDLADREPGELLARFTEEAERWCAGRPVSDDMTFIGIRVRDRA